MRILFLFGILLSFYFTFIPKALAVQTCQGVVSDSQGKPLANVEITFVNTRDNPRIITTNEPGGYRERIDEFGSGGLQNTVKEVIFKKDGYQTLSFNTASTKQCPGNVVLAQSTGTENYVCDPKRGCLGTTTGATGAQYSSIDVCTVDCKKLKFDAFTGVCNYPSSTYRSQKQECANADKPVLSTPTPTPTPIPLPLNCVEGTYKDTSDKEIVTTDKKLMKKCTKIDTALGNFDIEPAGFITRVFGIILSLAGGIALLLIIVSGYRLMVSQGNPEKVQAAREQLTSAIVGLLFIIFSVAILQIIGVDILQIPGFRR